MRIALIISGLLHAGVAAATFIALPARTKPPIELPPVLPLELVEIAEQTNIAPAVKREAPEEQPEPEIEDTAPEEAAPPEPTARPERAQPEPPPEVEAEPAPEFDRPLEPEPVEPEPEPEPAAPEPQRFAGVQPRQKPDLPKPREDQADFFSNAAALLDRKPREEKERVFHQDGEGEGTPDSAQESRAAAGLQTDLTLSEIDAIRTQIRDCWNLQAGAAEAEKYLVTLSVDLRRDGSVIGQPKLIEPSLLTVSSDKFYRDAYERAKRAILQCQPYELPPERYDSWRTVVLEFDPRFLLGP